MPIRSRLPASGALALCALLVLATARAAEPSADPLAAAVASPGRTPEFVKRDRYRHPLETLRFFGLKPDQTVVEVWPGGGWYTEILAPFLHDHGTYYAAGSGGELPGASEENKQGAEALRKRMTGDPQHFGKVVVTTLKPPTHTQIAPDGSADVVLTFRNVHNWIENGTEQVVFQAFYRALKPGGTLGVVEHRARPGTSIDQMKKSGYVTEEYVRKLARDAGFRFVADSPVNANPKDTKDYPEGVWTLPPTLALGAKDRDRYLAIGESDRMTLKFVKPAQGAGR